MTISPADALRLADEYDDLAEEYFDCDDHDERLRCWYRMRQIASVLNSDKPDLPEP